MALATLSIDLEARIASFERGLDKAARIAEKNAEATRAAWARAGAGLAVVAGGIASLFAGVTVAGKLNASIEALDALNDVADATGASIENISALEDIALRTGTTLDTVSTSLIKFNAELNDIKPDSPTALALRRIGLEAAELRKLDPAEALRRVAVALSGYSGEGEKARLVQELFGKSIKDVAPFLKDLAEQGQLNAKVTTEQAAEAEKFRKQMFELQTNIENVSRGLAKTLVPAINQYIEAVRQARGLGSVVLSNLALDDLSFKRKELENQNLAIAREASVAAQLKDALDRDSRAGLPVNPSVSQAYDASRAKLRALQQQALATSSSLKQMAEDINPTPSSDNFNDRRTSPEPQKELLGAQGGKKQTEQINEAQRALAAFVAEQQRELDKSIEITDQQKALNLLKELGTTGEIPQVRELVLGLSQKVTVLKQEEAIRKNIAENEERDVAALKALDDALDAFAGRAADALKRVQTARLEARIAAGEQFTPEELDKIVRGIGGITEPTKAAFDEMDELTKQFGRNVQDALGTTIKSSLKGDFDDILDLWLNLLGEMAAQALAAQIGKSLFGDLFKTGNLGGIFGGLFGGGGGNSGGSGTLMSLFASFGGGFFAAGGDHPGGLRIVGENGPELEMTGPSRIWSFEKTKAALGGGGGAGRLQLTYAPVIQLDGTADRAQGMSDMQRLLEQNNRELLALLKAKGVF